VTLPDLRHEAEAVLLDDLVALRVDRLVQRQLVAVAASTAPDVDPDVGAAPLPRQVGEQRVARVGGHLEAGPGLRGRGAHAGWEPRPARRVPVAGGG
jgi:hypothetical protein